MTRRTLLATTAAFAMQAGAAPGKYKMGVATTSYGVWKPNDTLEFLRHAVSIGAAGIQAPITDLQPSYIKTLRSELHKNGLYFEAMIPLRTETAQLEKALGAAKEAGAVCVRTACLSGRRYENFQTLESWIKFVDESKTAVARALPLAAKAQLPLAIENHKDWTVDEFVTLLNQNKSPYLGACLDTGNNIALLDDPYEVVQRLAPYAISTHIKDMGVAPANNGFYLSEVVLGTGMLDLHRMIAVIQKARPKTHLTVEMITRDPLNVPCLTDQYWASFPGRSGLYLARTLRTVHEKASKLPKLTGLDPAAQRKLEDDNVRACLRFA
ncbi:MAG TPA: TIM barrel protein [Bryobacteraceae bacterium]|jgi:sugar phosphate isomerase/epimerase|nr:TIM barrel protein [Bryobacteraceae bacterium]